MHSARLANSPRLRRVHDLLSDGAEHSTLEISIRAEVCAVNSCVAELRDQGADIHCRQTRSMSGKCLWLYRMVSPVEGSA